VVEAQAGGVGGRAADRLHERREARLAQLPRVEGRHPPVLAVGEEVVGRRPDAHLGHQQVLPPPGVAAIRGETHRHIGDQADLLRRPPQLAVEVELEPHVVGDSLGELIAPARDALGARVPQLLGPAAPRGADDLADGAERGVVDQALALAPGPAVQAVRFGQRLEHRLEGSGLQPEDRVVVDERLRVQGHGLASQGLELGRAEAGAGHLVDPQVQRVQEAARGGVVGAWLLVRDRGLRAERVDQQEGGAVLARPAAEAAEVGEVADAPALA
jgi:hypothetical protein